VLHINGKTFRIKRGEEKREKRMRGGEMYEREEEEGERENETKEGTYQNHRPNNETMMKFQHIYNLLKRGKGRVGLHVVEGEVDEI
jgi:hypothetical protein